MSPFSECVVHLADIQLDDQTYRITTETDKHDLPLQQSIAEVGLLSLPILQVSGHDTYRVVSGFRRLTALVRLGLTQTPCRVLGQTIDALTCLKIAITDNAWQRPLNPGEQARAVYKLSLLIEHPAHLRKTAALMGLPSTTDAVNNMLAVHSLPAVIFDSFSEERLAFSTVLSLTTVEDQAAISLARFLVELKLGGNKQRQAMNLITEIAAVEGIPLSVLLAETSLQDIVNNPDTDRGLRSETFFRYLRRRRFPNIFRVEENFVRKVKSLRPGHGAVLKPPAGFEGGDYTLQLTFGNNKEIESHIAFLQRIADSDLIGKKQ